MTVHTSGEQAGQRIRDRLSRTVGAGKFDLWFGAARLDPEPDGLGVTVPNRFVADWIDRHFHDTLLEATQAEFGDGAAVHLHVDPQLSSAKQDEPHAERNATANDPVRGSHGNPAEPTAQSRRNGSPSASAEPPPTGRDTPQFRRGKLRHDLSDFVVGPSNKLAYAAAERLLREPDSPMNPLFVHGGCGLGKTHLLQGLCRRFLERHPSARWSYTTAEQFTNQYIHAVRNNKLGEFRRRLRRLDLLAVDDVHFLANKSATQTEFLHTFDAIDLHGAKLVLASDAHPKLIKELADQLVSRFMSGMVARIEPPDPDTRLRIIRAAAERRGLVMRDNAVQTLAHRCRGSVREIEGTLTKIAAVASLETGGGEGPIGHAALQQALGASAGPETNRRPVGVESIIQTVCHELNVERAQVLSRSRHRRVVLARSAIVYLARELTTLSYPELARKLGRSNHSSVVTAVQRVDQQVRQAAPVPLLDPAAPATMDRLIEQLRHSAVQQAGNK